MNEGWGIGLTFRAEDLLNSHYVVVVEDRQVLYFAQGCQWETHVC